MNASYDFDNQLKYSVILLQNNMEIVSLRLHSLLVTHLATISI